MSSAFTTEQRKALRYELLVELYARLYSSQGGSWIIGRKEMDEDIEQTRAFEYLAGKGYATIERERNGELRFFVKLTSAGVDKFESESQ